MVSDLKQHFPDSRTMIAAQAPLWWPPAKIAARYLAPYLAEHADLAFGAFGQRPTLAS